MAVAELPRHRDRVVAHLRSARVAAADLERAGEASEHADAQLRRLVAERDRRALEQLDCELVGDHRPPARLLVADGGPREQLGVTQSVGEIGRLGVGRQRVDGAAGPVPGGPELEQQPGALGRLGDAELEGDAQPFGRGVEVEAVARRPGRAHVVLDAALDSAERRGRGEVVREVGDGARARALERLADAQVQLGAPDRRQAVVERAADELVREPVGQPARRKLLDHAARDRLVQRGQQLGVGHRAQHVELELGARRRRQLQQVGGRRPQAGQPSRHDLAHALRRRELLQRPGEPDVAAGDLDGVAVDQAAPQLADQERVAVRQVGDRARQLGLVAARHAAHELGHLVPGQAAEAQPHDLFGAAQVGEQLRQRVGQVGLGVAERGHQQQARAPAGARQVPQQAERGGVGPVRVLEHEQHGAVEAGPLEQRGDCRVQAVALGVRVGGRRSLRAARPQITQRLDEGLVWRTHDRVARAVEDERPAPGRLGRELAHEPALAGPRLAAQQRDPPPFALRPRDQRLQRDQLALASHEREPRREAQRARQRAHSQI